MQNRHTTGALLGIDRSSIFPLLYVSNTEIIVNQQLASCWIVELSMIRGDTFVTSLQWFQKNQVPILYRKRRRPLFPRNNVKICGLVPKSTILVSAFTMAREVFARWALGELSLSLENMDINQGPLLLTRIEFSLSMAM